MTINKIKIVETGFRTLTKILDTRGRYFCISKPIAKGIKSPKAVVRILVYGTPRFARSNINFPSVKIQSGIVPKEAIVEIVVIAMERFIFPPKI